MGQSYEIRRHKERLQGVGRKEDLKLLCKFVEGLAACHSSKRVIAQVEMIASKWERVKEHLSSPQ